jgi:uncharacterized membrane protein (UPF0127 family)
MIRLHLLIIAIFFLFRGSLLAAKEAEIQFKRQVIKLANQRISVEIADTDEKSERGLMYRKSLKKNEGMLFVFPNEQKRSFWMKNTFIDLSVAFFDSNRILTEIHDMKASSSELTIHPDSCESKKPAQFALEMSRGWFKNHSIKVGTKLEISTSK